MERTSEKAKSQKEHEFLENLNSCVRPLNDSLSMGTSKRAGHPFIFVIGAPRAGTTLLAQAIAYCYKVGYITNVAARFWLTPLVGIDLSHSVLGYDPAFDMGCQFFKSSCGRTRGGGGLHEFGYFWQRWLCPAGSPIPMDVTQGLYLELAAIQNRLGAPLVMKGAIIAMYHRVISRIVGLDVVWVNIERDLQDNCISILDARRAYFGNDHAWFGYEIPGLRERAEPLGAHDQIAMQVCELRDYYRSIADCTVSLWDLCVHPKEALSNALSEQPPFLREPPGASEQLPFLREPPGTALGFMNYDDREVDKVLFTKALERYCK